MSVEILEGAAVALGGTRGFEVTRTLPNKQRRMVGAWCFLDAYGPHELGTSPGMRVGPQPGIGVEPQPEIGVEPQPEIGVEPQPEIGVEPHRGMRVGPHPHTGLQTVTWLVAGEVLHRDSLGNRQEIRPGQLNLMTAGRGIAHAEETPVVHSPVLQGVQLWVALPHAARDMPAAFAHHADLPVVRDGGLATTVLMGTLAGVTSPAACHTPLAGAEIQLGADAAGSLPLRPDFEYAILALDGPVNVDGVSLKPGPLGYLGLGRTGVRLSASSPARALLLGGEPFEERLVMWWNFVGREHDEIVQMRADWADETPRFGVVHGYDGARLPAPPMPITRLVPRGRVR